MSEELQTEAEVVSEQTDSLEAVEKAVEQVVSHNDELAKENSELKLEAKNASEELAEIKGTLEDIKAKQTAPAFIATKTKESESMRSKADEQFNIFLKEGIQGLKTKAADMQIGVDARGGFALPEELRRDLINLQYETSPLRQVCDVTTSSTTDVKHLAKNGAAASGWVAETDARANTDSPELVQRTAVFGEVFAMPLIYQIALEDAFVDLKGYVMSEITRQFNEVEGLAFLSGNGTNKPKGILDGQTAGANAALDNATATYQVIDSGVDGALGADASATFNFLRAVVRSVKTPYLANCRWMMNRATHETLVALQNADNEYYMQRDVTAGSAARLFGYEIVLNEDMSSAPVTTGADFPIMFGDFAQSYQIIDRVGVSMLEDPYTQKGATSYYTRKRVGSMRKNVETLKLVSIAKS